MKKVLVIDDEPDLRHSLSRAVASFGYDVKDAANGAVGLKLCKEWEPDAILTDIYMPEQDGLELITHLQKLRTDARIIAMSGGGEIGMLGVLPIAKDMGAAHILTKPFELSELKTALSDVFSERTTES